MHDDLPLDQPEQRLEEREVDPLAVEVGVVSRAVQRGLIAKAPISAVTVSACEKPVCTGGPSAKPVTWTTPLRASPTLPKPGVSRAC